MASGEPAAAHAGAGSSWPAAAALVLAALLGASVLHAASVTGPERLTPTASYADGAPPGFSGGFGEQSCHACHFHNDLDAEPGRVTIAGLPERFVPGTSYPLTITLTRPGMTIGGFQLAARLEDGGAQAGTLAPGPSETERLAVETQGGVEYANQRVPGTALAEPDTAQWTVLWTAPATRETVQIHIAANAADKDGTAEGDYVHTTVVAVQPSHQPEAAR